LPISRRPFSPTGFPPAIHPLLQSRTILARERDIASGITLARWPFSAASHFFQTSPFSFYKQNFVYRTHFRLSAPHQFSSFQPPLAWSPPLSKVISSYLYFIFVARRNPSCFRRLLGSFFAIFFPLLRPCFLVRDAVDAFSFSLEIPNSRRPFRLFMEVGLTVLQYGLQALLGGNPPNFLCGIRYLPELFSRRCRQPLVCSPPSVTTTTPR